MENGRMHFTSKNVLARTRQRYEHARQIEDKLCHARGYACTYLRTCI